MSNVQFSLVSLAASGVFVTLLVALITALWSISKRNMPRLID